MQEQRSTRTNNQDNKVADALKDIAKAIGGMSKQL